jgi:hypothetical protein
VSVESASAPSDPLQPAPIQATAQPVKDYDGVYLKAVPYCYHCHKVTPGICGNRCGDCGERKVIIPGVTT